MLIKGLLVGAALIDLSRELSLKSGGVMTSGERLYDSFADSCGRKARTRTCAPGKLRSLFFIFLVESLLWYVFSFWLNDKCSLLAKTFAGS